MHVKEAIQYTHQLSGRWVMPILIHLQSSGGRFTPLQKKLGISPSRLSDNMTKLVSAEVLQRLTPYERRHPLLPEYKLTPYGNSLLEIAMVIQSAEETINHGPLHRKNWNWPILLALFHQYDRFQSISELLGKPSPRILSTRLNELCGMELIKKEIKEEPRLVYTYKIYETYCSSMAVIWKEISEIEWNKQNTKG
ncbi:winged helix-turn-helix transcriptional regulator [Gracilibacillus saliphilus]|uniref:winged helix-turn-helix transcriptional regulator n=1 Tax=Gracilibacillus saliphilus TaxID=543890 RepID=UPI0013D3F40B|nr:winged helix-turn-helix transcriptional regulator [Gracilibacillus saliphilus]